MPVRNFSPFPDQNQPYDVRLQNLKTKARRLAEKKASPETEVVRKISYVLGNSFDAVADGTKLNKRSVQKAFGGEFSLKLRPRKNAGRS